MPSHRHPPPPSPLTPSPSINRRAQQVSTDTRIYTVPDISCDHCKRAIEDQVTPLAGVDKVSVDIDNKTVTVTGGDPAAVEAAIADAGYTIT